MSKAEELLESLTVVEHEHEVEAKEVTFEIDPESKSIFNVTGTILKLNQGEHKSTRFVFNMPRYINGHDMMLCNMVYIPYINAEPDSRTQKFRKGVCTVADMQLVNEDTIKFTWLVTRNSTYYAGGLSFMVIFQCMEGERILYSWNAEPNSDVVITAKLDSGETFEYEYIDIIEQWKSKVKDELVDYVDDVVAKQKYIALITANAEDIAELDKYVDVNLSELRTSLTDNTTKLTQQIDVLEARMNTFSSLEDGSTTSDAELMDLRVHYNGDTSETAGEASRVQFGELFNALDDSGIVLKIEDLVDVSGYYIDKNGVVFNNDGYSYSEPITLPSGSTVVFTARGYKTQVAMISELTSDDVYNPLVASIDSELHDYTYTTVKETQIVFCWANSDSYVVRGYTNIPKLLEVLYNASTENLNTVEEKLKSERIMEDYVSLSLFSKFGVIGDSYASGEVYFDDSFHDIYSISWGQILARKLGTQCVNFSAGGLSTRGWLTNSHGLDLLEATEALDIYYLALGINDANYYGEDYIGSLNDIVIDNYEDNADSFYGNYGRIISKIKEYAPNAKIVMSTMVPTTDTKALYNDAIVEIAAYFGIPYIVQTDDEFFVSDFYTDGKVQNHPVAIVYSGMANAIERLVKKCVIENYDYFADAFMYK